MPSRQLQPLQLQAWAVTPDWITLWFPKTRAAVCDRLLGSSLTLAEIEKVVTLELAVRFLRSVFLSTCNHQFRGDRAISRLLALFRGRRPREQAHPAEGRIGIACPRAASRTARLEALIG